MIYASMGCLYKYKVLESKYRSDRLQFKLPKTEPAEYTLISVSTFVHGLGNLGLPEPENSGIRYFGLCFFRDISIVVSENPNFKKPKIPDPKIRVNPNAQGHVLKERRWIY